MAKLITDAQANIYFGSISDNIEKYRSRANIQTTSADLPLFIDQIGRLRDVFQKILSSIDDSNIEFSDKLGTKLRNIFLAYPPSRKIDEYVFSAWQKVNNCRHYEEKKAKGEIINYDESHYKATIRSMCEFVTEYSGIKPFEKVYKFYVDRGASAQSRPIQPQPTQPLVKQTLQNIPLTARQKELRTIGDTRLPMLFVLDTSLSMNAHHRIEDLNKGVKFFYDAMKTDEITRDSVELSIITFGHEVKQLIEFSSIDRADNTFHDLNLEADGTRTCLGEAMLKAIEITDDLKNEYSDAGIDFHQPWIILITDCDSQGIDNYKESAQRVAEKISGDKLVLFPIAVGSGDLNILTDFSPNRDPLLMRDKKFGEFFGWLQENALFISRSRPDEKKPLKEPKGWATL